jgi:hypothetical protein
MFQFPRFPPRITRGHPSPGGVAPFGLRRIAGCQHLPGAFRRVATSFIGPWRLGIHHVLFCDYVAVQLWCVLRGARGDVRVTTLAAPAVPLFSCSTCPQTQEGGAAGIRTPDLRRARAALSRLSYGPLDEHARPRPWARLDSNQGPRPYQGRALTT